MDSMDSPHSLSALSGTDATRRELHTLRLTLQITLAALLILAGSVAILIFRQVSLLRRQADATARQAQQVAQIFNSTIGPQAQIFENKLQAFAETNAEFKARIARFYGASTPSNSPAPSTPPSTAPADKSPSPTTP
jgi:hypothetical protein